MEFRSTRGGGDEVGLEVALGSGTAPDGGLYMPTVLPELSVDAFHGAETWVEIAEELLKPFFVGSNLASQLSDICRDAFDFPLKVTGSSPHVLELFHGPTSAFKDVGARFLAACLSRIPEAQGKTILVATSGDTGGAVAAAFFRRSGFRVVILFPEGRVSLRQQHQLTCWGENILSLAVQGAFDDCQRMVKQAFANPQWVESYSLASANSINIGRLMPQMTYYAAASLWHYRAYGEKPNFLIPTGNLGNAFSCVLARAIGLPIGEIVLVTNANKPIPDFLKTGMWEPRATIETLASAMDVGNPSNMERLRDLYPDHPVLSQMVSAYSVDDESIKSRIQQEFGETAEVHCPHTATALDVYRREYPDQSNTIVVATAHAAKFDDIIEPLTGPVAVPDNLAMLLERPANFDTIEGDVEVMINRLANWEG
ncbi:MAG: threonine synthase [Pseudomonadota bacterium]